MSVASANTGKIPATIVTGFLGAGKTSLIQHLLKNAGGKRLALIINEFGELGVDGEIVKGCKIEGCPDENIVELANGCICCTVADDFLPTMKALLDRPGNDAIQLDLFEDYRSNVASYDKWHALFRQYRPKTLILWGKNDPIFIAPGAEAYKRDLPDARLVWLDAGHFVIDENAATIGREIKASFAGR